MSVAVPVLMYHHVSPAPGLVTILPERYRAQMAWLANNGYRSLTAGQFAAFLAGAPTPAKSVLITFDDGWLDNWIHAHPILAEFGLHAVLFAVTGWIGNGPARGTAPPLDHRNGKAAIAAGRTDDAMLRWSEIEAMAAAGTFECHSHTHSHTRWDRQMPPGPARDEALAADLASSRETLARRLGCTSSHLCWPQGYYDEDHIRVARAAGFSHLYTTENRPSWPGADPLRIGRQVGKDKGAFWFGSRMHLYSSPILGRLYSRLRGET